MALRLARTNNLYRTNYAYHCSRPVARGIQYTPDIHMTRFEKPKITAALMGRILEGRNNFFLPYNLTEINNDFTMDKKKIKLSVNSENIIKWLDNQKIKYEINPKPSHIEYLDDDVERAHEYVSGKKMNDDPLTNHITKVENDLIVSNYSRINDVVKWLEQLKRDDPEAYVEKYTYDPSRTTHFVKYWSASMWLEMTADTVIDETDLAKFADKI